MKIWTLTMRIETEDEDNFTDVDIRSAVYEAGGDLPFGFDITDVRGQE